MENLEDKVIPEPTELTDTEKESEVKNKIKDKEVENYVKRVETLVENKKKAYNLVWGQCSEAVQHKLKSIPIYKKMHDDEDVIELLKQLKGVCYKFEQQKYLLKWLLNAKKNFYLFKQRDLNNAQYFDQFKNAVDVVEQYEGYIW